MRKFAILIAAAIFSASHPRVRPNWQPAPAKPKSSTAQKTDHRKDGASPAAKILRSRLASSRAVER